MTWAPKNRTNVHERSFLADYESCRYSSNGAHCFYKKRAKFEKVPGMFVPFKVGLGFRNANPAAAGIAEPKGIGPRETMRRAVLWCDEDESADQRGREMLRCRYPLAAESAGGDRDQLESGEMVSTAESTTKATIPAMPTAANAQ